MFHHGQSLQLEIKSYCHQQYTVVLISCKQATLLFFLPSFSPSLLSSSPPTLLWQYCLLGVSSRQTLVSFPSSLPLSPWHLFSFLPDSVTALALCLCVSSLWSAIIPPPPPPPPPPPHQLCQRYISTHHIADGKEKKRAVREETMKEYFWTPPRWKQKRLYASGGGSPYILHSPPPPSTHETKKLHRRATTTTMLKISCCCLRKVNIFKLLDCW